MRAGAWKRKSSKNPKLPLDRGGGGGEYCKICAFFAGTRNSRLHGSVLGRAVACRLNRIPKAFRPFSAPGRGVHVRRGKQKTGKECTMEKTFKILEGWSRNPPVQGGFTGRVEPQRVELIRCEADPAAIQKKILEKIREYGVQEKDITSYVAYGEDPVYDKELNACVNEKTNINVVVTGFCEKDGQPCWVRIQMLEDWSTWLNDHPNH